MANLYIYAGQVAHTYKELATIMGVSYFGAKGIVARWSQSVKNYNSRFPPWFHYFKIDEETTDAYIEKIRAETYDRYVLKCDYYDQEIKFPLPQGAVEWKYTPPRELVPLEDQKDGGGCKHRLWKRGDYYYQTHGLDVWETGDLVYQNHDPERVNRVHRQRCCAENLWHPWRKVTYSINGTVYKTMVLAAAAAGVSYWKFRRKIKACQYHECAWPEGWKQVWE